MRYGRFVIKSHTKALSKASSYWVCACDCGKEKIVSLSKLKAGTTKSCGCLRTTKIKIFNHKHGFANKSITYRSWKEMRQRCLNPNSDKWKWYGGRGISICDDWNSFDKFLSDMGERPAGMSIDRIDPDGDYCPENCRWATPKQQAETNRGCFQIGNNRHGLRTFEKVKGA